MAVLIGAARVRFALIPDRALDSVGNERRNHPVVENRGDVGVVVQALRHGLVSEVVPAAELLAAARRMAERILALGPLAVRLAKAALNASAQMPLAAGLVFESTVQAIAFASVDKSEGTTAFLEKRRPQFRGE